MVNLSSAFLISNLFSSFTWLFGPQNPQWLESLKLEYPFLSTSEYNFVVDVRLRSLRKTGSGTELSNDEILKIKQNVATVKDNFNQMVEQLKVSSLSRERFTQAYPEWISARDFNVHLLNEIANTADSYKRKGQIAKVVGSALSLIGGGLSLMTSVGDSDMNQLYGSILMGLGLFTSAGTSVTETVLLRNSVEKAKDVIKKDDENFEKLMEWVTGVSHLQKTLEGIKSIGLNGHLQAAAKQLADVSKKDLNRREKEEAVRNILESFHFPADIAEEISDLVGILISTSMIFDHYQVLFDVALKAYGYVPQLRLAMEMFRNAYTSMNIVANAVKLTESQIRRVTAGMLLDVVNIIIISAEDPSSIEGQHIRQAANALEREAFMFKNLYDQMKSFEIKDFRERLD